MFPWMFAAPMDFRPRQADLLHMMSYDQGEERGFLSHGSSPKSFIYRWILHYKPTSYWGTLIYGHPQID